MEIRIARASDAKALADIYAPYVEKTAITFEYDAPSALDFCDRINSTLEKYPFLVAIENGECVGYTYASAFKNRKAYDYSVETSIYIRQDRHSMGYGRMLYQRLEELLKKQNITNLNVCIAYTENTDEYLDNGSIDFHYRMGYSMVGRFHKCGYKLGKWYDMVWMEKMISEHIEKPYEFVPFSKIII